MGFSDQEIGALSGACDHGRCHNNLSGFHGAWINAPTRFSNTYFRFVLSRGWKEKVLDNGVRQLIHYDEGAEEELMMLPTDLAQLSDSTFRPCVELYTEDEERFFADFAAVFAMLIELSIQRDETGRITNSNDVPGGYHSAPKKSSAPGLEQEVDVLYGEAEPLREENRQFRARLSEG